MNFLRNLGDIIERFKAGEKLEPADYVFFSLFVVLSVMGMIVQMKAIHRENQEKKTMTEQLMI